LQKIIKTWSPFHVTVDIVYICTQVEIYTYRYTMKKIIYAATRLATVAVAVSLAIPAFSRDNLDSDGYPIMYVRGSFSDWGWDEAYRMTRQGDVYTITLASIEGEFKFSGTDWQYNYGAANNATVITGPANLVAQPNGPNYRTDRLVNVTFSFKLNRDGESLTSSTLCVSVDGNAPVLPPPAISGTLPVLYINVYADGEHTVFDNEVISKDLAHKNYFRNSEYWLDLNGCTWLEEQGAASIGSAEERLPLEIKARGNWTRKGFAKKPYKIKLGSKQAMLGLSKSKHFALLAHADDTWGYTRNFAGFNLGRRIGLPWTPWQQPVELVINGDYRGLYFLTESIRVDKDRVDIAELDDNVVDSELISGGYLVELDNYDEDNQIRMTEKSCVSNQNLDRLRITFDTPEVYSDIQRRFVSEQFAAMNDAAGACSDELWAYIDLDDAARYYLVEEIMSHTESYHGSTYLFRDRGEGQKWHFSPLWDFGNAYSGPTDGFFYNHDPYGNTWIPSFRENARFNAKVKETWLWFMNEAFDGLYDDIEAYALRIADAARADRKRWANAPVPDGGSPVADNSNMASRSEASICHIKAKVEWLKTCFGNFLAGGPYAEPERDSTPAAPLPGYAASGMESVYSPSFETVYYNMQGVRIDRPVSGLLIVRRGEDVKKMIIK